VIRSPLVALFTPVGGPETLRLLRSCGFGFTVDDLIEIQAPADPLTLTRSSGSIPSHWNAGHPAVPRTLRAPCRLPGGARRRTPRGCGPCRRVTGSPTPPDEVRRTTMSTTRRVLPALALAGLLCTSIAACGSGSSSGGA